MDRWVRLYPGVAGIFVDEQASAAERVDYYAVLYEYARKQRGLRRPEGRRDDGQQTCEDVDRERRRVQCSGQPHAGEDHRARRIRCKHHPLPLQAVAENGCERRRNRRQKHPHERHEADGRCASALECEHGDADGVDPLCAA